MCYSVAVIILPKQAHILDSVIDTLCPSVLDSQHLQQHNNFTFFDLVS